MFKESREKPLRSPKISKEQERTTIEELMGKIQRLEEENERLKFKNQLMISIMPEPNSQELEEPFYGAENLLHQMVKTENRDLMEGVLKKLEGFTEDIEELRQGRKIPGSQRDFQDFIELFATALKSNNSNVEPDVRVNLAAKFAKITGTQAKLIEYLGW